MTEQGGVERFRLGLTDNAGGPAPQLIPDDEGHVAHYSDHLERVEELERERDELIEEVSGLHDAILSRPIPEAERLQGKMRSRFSRALHDPRWVSFDADQFDAAITEALERLTTHSADHLQTDGELMEGARPNGPSVEDQLPVRGGADG